MEQNNTENTNVYRKVEKNMIFTYENRDAYNVTEMNSHKFGLLIFATIFSIVFGLIFLTFKWVAPELKKIKAKYSLLTMIPLAGGVIAVIYCSKVSKIYKQVYGHEPKLSMQNTRTGEFLSSL